VVSDQWSGNRRPRRAKDRSPGAWLEFMDGVGGLGEWVGLLALNEGGCMGLLADAGRLEGTHQFSASALAMKRQPRSDSRRNLREGPRVTQGLKIEARPQTQEC
jgi:hypothetical protein